MRQVDGFRIVTNAVRADASASRPGTPIICLDPGRLLLISGDSSNKFKKQDDVTIRFWYISSNDHVFSQGRLYNLELKVP